MKPAQTSLRRALRMFLLAGLWATMADMDPLAAREGAIETIRNVAARGPSLFGGVERTRVNSTDYAIVTGYVLDFGLPILLQSWFFNDDNAGASMAAALEGDPFFFDPAVMQPNPNATYYLNYPYAEHFHGYVYRGPFLQRRQAGEQQPHMPASLRRLIFELRLENNHDFGWHLNTTRGTARWDGLGMLSFDTSWAWLVEDLNNGRTDALGLFDFNLCLSVISETWCRLRMGFGSNHTQDGRNSTRGINLTALIDLYILEPLVVSAEWDIGTLGQALLTHQRYAIGLMLGRWQLAAGFDQLRVDNLIIRGPQIAASVYF